MMTDGQVRLLRRNRKEGKTQEVEEGGAGGDKRRSPSVNDLLVDQLSVALLGQL